MTIDTAKLKTAAEKRANRLWERMEDAAKDNAQQMRDIAIDSLVALDKAELLVVKLIAALEAERADCRENAARIAEMESQRALAFSACNRWADKCRDAEKRVAELEREHAAFRPVGVMSEGAFHRLENSECRFIALWPRPGIYLPRKRPDDGVVVYARTELAGINLETGGE